MLIFFIDTNKKVCIFFTKYFFNDITEHNDVSGEIHFRSDVADSLFEAGKHLEAARRRRFHDDVRLPLPGNEEQQGAWRQDDVIAIVIHAIRRPDEEIKFFKFHCRTLIASVEFDFVVLFKFKLLIFFILFSFKLIFLVIFIAFFLDFSVKPLLPQV